MAIKKLHLNNLPNDKHLGAGGQIWEFVKDLSVDSFPLLTQRKNAFHDCVLAEDAAYRRSPKDFTTDDMHGADDKRDDYMSAVRAIASGYALLPDESPLKRMGKEVYQVFKDYGFSTGDSYTGQSTKMDNMWQVFQTMQSKLEQLGVWSLLQTAMTYNEQVKAYFQTRIENLAERTVGEMRDARAATDQAYQALIEVMDAILVLGPTPELLTAERNLNALTDYYKQYYMKGGSQGGSSSSGGNGSSGDNGTSGNSGDSGNSGETGDDDGPSSGEGDTSGDDDGPSSGEGDTSGDDNGGGSQTGDGSDQ